MIAARDERKPDARELRACGLAALAEAAVVALPAHMILTQSSDVRIGAVAFTVPFAVAYVLGTTLLCRFRATPNAPLTAGVAAALVGLRLGWGGDLNRLVFVVVVTLLVVVRMVALALRDWRTPYHADFGWMALALGGEVALATGPQPEWQPVLVVAAPLFFVAALASRATTVWTEAGATDLDEAVRAGWVRRALLAALGLVAAMATAVLLGIEGGLFDRIGAALAPLGAWFASALAWTLSQLARPVFWLVDLLNIDPEAVREFLESLRANAGEAQRRVQQPGPPALWQRLLGLTAFALVALLLVRVIRRFRPQVSATGPMSSSEVAMTTAALVAEAAPRRRGPFRRELPADRVRRWYAETLLELDRLRVAKDPALTPAEFVPEVAVAFPQHAEDFRALTHAYEDVRYGSLTLDTAALQRLEARATATLDDLRRTKIPPVDLSEP